MADQCECCGAPVGADGRYERADADAFVTDGGQRYEGPSESPFVTELKRLRSMPARVGSERWWRERTGHEEGCRICGGELPANDEWRYSGEPRVHGNRSYCSDACKQKAYRIRKKARAANENTREDADG